MPSLPHTLPFPFFSGSSAVSADVPSRWPVSLNGRNLVLDIEGKGLYQTDRWKHTSIQLIRPQQDNASHPSEASLNPEGLWRRAEDSWHHGAGQTFRDRSGGEVFPSAGGDDFRFRTSKGIDPWTYWQISLLPDTTNKYSSANTNLYLAVAGSRLYVTDNQTLKYTVDETTWTTVTGTPAVAIAGICSDGFDVWIASGASGIYSTNTGTGAAASYTTGTVGGPIAYVKGRLMAANTNSIYNVIVGGGAALPTALFTHGNTSFRWVGFAGGQTGIYMAGYSGDKSLIYRTAIKPDGTTLDAPTVAGELPDGEIITSIDAYLGVILIGSNQGCRYATSDASGNLVIGSLIPTSTSVLCFEGQGPYVWFGWTNYDGVSTGLGRMDLRVFTETLETGARVPAYASDMMVTSTAIVQSAATFLSKRVFTVSGLGVYTESVDKVTTGTLDTGLIGFGIPDNKLAVSINVRTLPLAGSLNAYVATDSGLFTNIGADTIALSTNTDLPMAFTSGERFEVRFVLTRDAITTTGPTITRWTLKASPGAIDGPAEIITAPFLLHQTVDVLGREETLDVQYERDSIKVLRDTQQIVTYQEGTSSYDVVVMDYQWIPYHFAAGDLGRGGYGDVNGTMVTQLKRLN